MAQQAQQKKVGMGRIVGKRILILVQHYLTVEEATVVVEGVGSTMREEGVEDIVLT